MDTCQGFYHNTPDKTPARNLGQNNHLKMKRIIMSCGGGSPKFSFRCQYAVEIW